MARWVRRPTHDIGAGRANGIMTKPIMRVGEVLTLLQLAGFGIIAGGVFKPRIQYVLSQEPETRMSELIKQLGSDSPASRDTAMKELRKAGSPAKLSLEKAKRESDREIAGRAGRLLDLITIEESLTANLISLDPQVAEYLLDQRDKGWTKLLLRLDSQEILGRLGKKDFDVMAKGALKGASSDDEMEQVAEVIGRRQLTSGSDGLVPLLQSENPRVRNKAIWALGEINSKAIAPRIAGVLKHPRSEVRVAAVDALERIRAKETWKEIAHLAGDPSPEVRFSVVRWLWRMNVIESKDRLLGLLEDERDYVRAAAADALGDLGAKEDCTRVSRLIEDDSHWVSGAAIATLGRHKVSNIVPSAVKLILQSGARLERKSIPVELRIHRHDPFGVERLLSEARTHFVWQCLSALIRLGAKDSLKELACLESDGDQAVRIAWAITLGELGGDGANSILIRMTRDASPDVRRFSLKALERRQAADSVPSLLDSLATEEDCDVQSSLATALASLGGVNTETALQHLLQSRLALKKGNALLVLSKFRVNSCKEAIFDCLNEEHAEVRQRALDAVKRVDDLQAKPLVLSLVADRNELVRRSAVATLGALLTRAEDSHLVPLLEDSSASVRREAARSLCRIGSTQGVTQLFGHPDSIWFLNAISQPELWKRLGRDSTCRELRGSRMEILMALGKESQIEIEAPNDEESLEWFRVYDICETRMEQNSIAERIEGFLGGFKWMSPILERPNKLRLVPIDEAIRWWARWQSALKK